MSAPMTHDPLVVNTQDGAVWMRRAVTREGRGLYAVADAPKCCPEYVMATLTELAEHGITGSAYALPMPVDPGPVVRPLKLREAQIDALAASGNRVVNDEMHQHLCMCDAWPEGCVSTGNYFMGAWDVSGLETAIPAVLGLWESMRGSELRRLRARVAELETERHSTNEALADVTVAQRAEESADKLTALFAPTQALRVEASAPGACDACGDLPERWCPDCGACKAGCHGGHEGNECAHANAPWSVRVLREDPHDGPLHHSYRVPRDLPESDGVE